jgi:hypothetical protein
MIACCRPTYRSAATRDTLFHKLPPLAPPTITAAPYLLCCLAAATLQIYPACRVALEVCDGLDFAFECLLAVQFCQMTQFVPVMIVNAGGWPAASLAGWPGR